MKKNIIYFFVVISFIFITGILVHAGTPKDTIVIACRFSNDLTLDPAETSDLFGIEYIMNTYDRLMACDAKDTCLINGAAAKSWSVSKDGKTFTFEIRKGLSFASGNPLTAHDAAFSLHRLIMLDKAPALILKQLGFSPENVTQKIKAKDNLTLVIETDRNYAPSLMMRCLTSPGTSILDKEEVLKNDENKDLGHKWLKTNYAGSGPYRLRQLNYAKSISLEKNNIYWAGRPKMGKIQIRNIADPSARALLAKMGSVDIARDIGADQVNILDMNPDLEVKSGPHGCLYYLGMNQKNDMLSNPKVKQALKYLVDYQDITANVLKENAVVHQSFFPKAYEKTGHEHQYSLDIEKAGALLEQAGHKKGFDITMNVHNTLPLTDIALALQSSFAKADIKLDINYINRPQLNTRDHELYLGCWGADFQTPETNAYAFACNLDNSDNVLNNNPAWLNTWEIPELSTKTELFLNESDHEKKAELLKELQKEYEQISPFVIMFQKIEVNAVNKNVKGFDFGPGSNSNYQVLIKD